MVREFQIWFNKIYYLAQIIVINNILLKDQIMSQSSWKDQIKQKWGPHLHCPVCGRAMSADKKLCGQSCKDNYITAEKKKKKSSRMQMVFLVVMMVFMIVLMPLLMGGLG